MKGFLEEKEAGDPFIFTQVCYIQLGITPSIPRNFILTPIANWGHSSFSSHLSSDYYKQQIKTANVIGLGRYKKQCQSNICT